MGNDGFIGVITASIHHPSARRCGDAANAEVLSVQAAQGEVNSRR